MWATKQVGDSYAESKKRKSDVLIFREVNPQEILRDKIQRFTPENIHIVIQIVCYLHIMENNLNDPKVGKWLNYVTTIDWNNIKSLNSCFQRTVNAVGKYS